MDNKAHWNKVYHDKKVTEVSWFQEHAETSLRLIRQHVTDQNAQIIDVGAGASTLVDDLIAAGYKNIDMLDISEDALAITRKRISNQNITSRTKLNWLIGDILKTDLSKQYYDVWHDRAVFHFLTNAEDRNRYIQQVLHALKPGGKIFISTFGPDGPLQCSGLPIVRYSHDSLHNTFGQSFKLLEHGEDSHQTPSGTIQKFIYCYCKLQN
jgi:2-polyprenyl-3-methyl-5-hydroxy-6-metoxy-1,4-benzoquinol methylase